MTTSVTDRLTMPRLRIDLDALTRNVAAFRARTRGLIAVVKADAFGHGDVAQHLLASGADWLGTTSIDHALELRGMTGARTLAWLSTPGSAFEEAVSAGVDIAVPSALHLHALAEAARSTGRPARVHLHIDLGMARDGAPREAWSELASLAGALAARGQIAPVGIMGHLSHAAVHDDAHNIAARLVFDNAVRAASRRGFRPQVRHIASTAATIAGIGTDLELARIGAGLYGIDPSHSDSFLLHPALTLEAPVILVRDVQPGTGVGYGHEWVATTPTRLATIAVGYADGLPRSVRGRAEVGIHGRRFPIVGAVSMDQVVIDVGDAPVRPGDKVTILGTDGPTLRDWAGWAQTIEHEFVTGLGSRWQRVLEGESSCG